MDILFINVAHAAQSSSLGALIDGIKVNIINPIIGILFAFALVMFLWGVAKYLFNAEDETARSQGKNHMIWGLVGMFIMVSVMGIIDIAMSIFGM